MTGVRASLRAVAVALIGLATPSIFPHNGGSASLDWPAEHSPKLRPNGLPATIVYLLHFHQHIKFTAATWENPHATWTRTTCVQKIPGATMTCETDEEAAHCTSTA